MQDAYAVVGLGNPGRRYAGTRHNVGYEVVAMLAQSWGARPASGKGDYLVASCRREGAPVLLAQPTTYMNLSGHAVQSLISYYEIEVERLLTVTDDVNLPLGQLRIRREGSAGGHKGLENIIYQLARDDFMRLRIGVGADNMPEDLTGYVLEPFRKEEQPVIQQAIATAADAVEIVLSDGIEEAMNRFN
jgi:PTH1 family peptidyl-tRNA hydrolase